MDGNVKAVSFISTSDQRLKYNIEAMSGLETILKLRGVSYNWHKDHSRESGVIAQEVEEVMPWAVVTGSDGYKAVKYQNLIAPLIESTKELYEMCEMSREQKDRKLAALEEEVSQLKSENDELKGTLLHLMKRIENLEKQTLK